MKLWYLEVCCLCVLLPFSSAFAERPTQDGKVVLFGNLHAHSALTVDAPPELTDEMSPRQAIEYAHQHGLDFLAITDHHKGKVPWRPNFLKLPQQEYKEQLLGVAKEYNAGHPGQFVEIQGIKREVISKINHVNVSGAKTIPGPVTIQEKEYAGFYTRASVQIREQT